MRPAQRGFSLIEVLVSLAILVFGLLGIAGLMVKGQKASYEAYQRQQALALAQDMVERIRANPLGAASYETGVADGAGMPGYSGTIAAATQCVAGACTADQLAAFDLQEWDRQLFGSSERLGGNRIGGIIRARGCVEQTDDPTRYVVSVSWQGDVPTSAPSAVACKAADGVADWPVSDCGFGLYGQETLRRMVSLCVSTRRVAAGGGS